MGMFDNIVVKMNLPLGDSLKDLKIDWSEEVFQTKDLDNGLELYEISPEGHLRFLKIEREWKKDEDSPLGGYLEPKSEEWVEIPFHGVIRFYTTHCDNPEFDDELERPQTKHEMTWQDVFLTKGNDWWIEFMAIFNKGVVTEIRLERAERTPISARLASQKEWELRRELKEKEPFNKFVRFLKKIPGYRTATRGAYRLEQRLHEKLSRGLLKIS